MPHFVGIFVLDYAVVGDDDARVEAEGAQMGRKRADDVGETSGLGQRSALSSGDEDFRH